MKKVLCKIIKIYQKFSSLKPNKCSLVPTCSNYAITAITRFGCIKGSWLAFKRLFRCAKKHQFGTVDDVPQNLKGDFKWLI